MMASLHHFETWKGFEVLVSGQTETRSDEAWADLMCVESVVTSLSVQIEDPSDTIPHLQNPADFSRIFRSVQDSKKQWLEND